MPSSKPIPIFSALGKCTAVLIAAGVLAMSAGASTVVYQASDSTNNFVPDADDGTPNRPVGDMMGNTITLAGTERYLASLTIRVATTDALAPDQTVAISIYQNDGGADIGGSGILQPDTLITSSTISDVSLASGVAAITFNFPSVQVPDTFTFIVDFSPGSAASILVGMMSNNSTAQIGTGIDRMWYGTGQAGGWLTDASWAVADGAVVNLVDAVVTADADPLVQVPEPSPILMAFAGTLIVQVVRRRIRSI